MQNSGSWQITLIIISRERMQLQLRQNFLRITTIQKEYAGLSLGVGAGFILEDRDPINAFIFPAQIEISPFKNELSFLSFIAEPSLLSYLEGEIQIRMLLGMKIRL